MENEILTNEDFTDVDVNSLGENEQGEENSTADLDEQEEKPDVEQSSTEQAPIDVNAIAAAARRKAEGKLEALNNRAKSAFGGYTNPVTGKPIESVDDYFDAVAAQEDMKRRQELEDHGISADFLDQAIANNPLIRQAQDVLELNRQQQMYAQINSDVAELNKLDSSITSLDNVPPQVMQLSMERGYSLVDSYKILNYGKVADSKQAAIQQNAINQAKGKAHLNPVNGVATPDDGVEIPSSVLAMWKEAFPEKSKSELKKLYNDSL